MGLTFMSVVFLIRPLMGASGLTDFFCLHLHIIGLRHFKSVNRYGILNNSANKFIIGSIFELPKFLNDILYFFI